MKTAHTSDDSKARKIEEIVNAIIPHTEEPLREELAGGAVSRSQMGKILQLLGDAFEEIVADDCMERILEKRIREMIMVFFELNYVRDVGDPALEKAVEIIRGTLVTRTERESIAKNLAEELKSDWKNLPGRHLDEIAGEGGLLQTLNHALEQGAPLNDRDIVRGLLKLCAHLWMQYIARLPEQELDRLLRDGIEILKAQEKKQRFEEPLLKWTSHALSQLGIIGIMRKSFTRLLIDDLVLHSVGRGLGLKGKTTVTDFIILVGVKIAEKRIREGADIEEVRRLRTALEKISSEQRVAGSED